MSRDAAVSAPLPPPPRVPDLRDYLRHLDGCGSLAEGDGVCSCGLDAAARENPGAPSENERLPAPQGPVPAPVPAGTKLSPAGEHCGTSPAGDPAAIVAQLRAAAEALADDSSALLWEAAEALERAEAGALLAGQTALDAGARAGELLAERDAALARAEAAEAERDTASAALAVSEGCCASLRERAEAAERRVAEPERVAEAARASAHAPGDTTADDALFDAAPAERG